MSGKIKLIFIFDFRSQTTLYLKPKSSKRDVSSAVLLVRKLVESSRYLRAGFNLAFLFSLRFSNLPREGN